MLWKVLGAGVALALAGFLLVQFGNARYKAGVMAERVVQTQDDLRKEQDRLKQQRADSDKVLAAVEGYANRMAGMEPIIVRSMDKVREYAQTPAGRTVCLPAERVLGVEQTAQELGLRSAGTAQGSPDPVPADPAP